MTIKLITYSRAFYPYILGYKAMVIIGVFLVMDGDKLLKRSFAELCGYIGEGATYAEIDALGNGIRWIVCNVLDTQNEKLEVFFCGAPRARMKKDIENRVLMNNYRRDEIFNMIEKFKEVKYTSQGKIISEDDIYDLYGFSNKVFELRYGRDNGYLHSVYETEGENVRIVGEPELWWRHGMPSEAWS